MAIGSGEHAASPGETAPARRSRPERIRAYLLSVRISLIAVAAPGLVRLPLPLLSKLLEPRRPPPQAADGANEVEGVAACVEQVLRSGRPWIRPGCLTRGITRYYFLRRIGLDLRLCFGAALDDGGKITGHCWLECAGEPYLEEGDPRTAFVEMHRISPSATGSAT